MIRRKVFLFVVLSAISLSLGVAAGAPSIYPTGVTRYDPQSAYGTYVLFGAPDDKTYLIDMDGNVVHSWDYTGHPSELLDPAVVHGEKGHVLIELKQENEAGGSRNHRHRARHGHPHEPQSEGLSSAREPAKGWRLCALR